MDTPTDQRPDVPKMKFTTGDYIFLSFMAVVVVAVVWIGILAHEEASKTEGAKRNGEQLVAWLTEAGTQRANPDYAIGACAAGGKAPEAMPAAEPAAQAASEPEGAASSAGAAPAVPAKEVAKGPNTWGACVEQMFSLPAFKDMKNPFFEERPQFVAACVPSDATLTGALVVEKLVPTPVGSSIPFVASQLVDTDLIDGKLQLRVSVCDKGSYAIKIAEFEF